MSDEEPEVLHLSRERNVLTGFARSRTTGVQYPVTVVLHATMLCGCPGNRMRDARCAHLKAILEHLDEQELRDFVLNAQDVPA